MTIYPQRDPPASRETMIKWLRMSVAVAERAAAAGNHPFGCLLVGRDGEVLFEQGNINTLNHAEMTCARSAFEKLSPEQLWHCTLVTNFESCCMCTGSMYWANIGRIVYGLPETKLLELTGAHDENPTLSLSSREVLKAGSKDIEVFGPFPEVEEEVLASHINFWKTR